jgi:hypothetical protein
VAELADALASGASSRKGVEVRVLSWAPFSGLAVGHSGRAIPRGRTSKATPWTSRSLQAATQQCVEDLINGEVDRGTGT